jgi:succinate dehydrogenase flavin-adding protein (antitoxin of CptAB toxin-antitoxin module)
MRELDDLLLRYLDNHYEQATDNDKQAFQALLALPDPELVGYLLNRQTPATELRRVVEHILERPDT